jgi:hypothetical protein
MVERGRSGPTIFATARVAEWLRHYGWGNFLGVLRCRLLKGCHLPRCWDREAAPHPPSRDGAAIPLRMGDALTMEQNPQDIPPYSHGGPGRSGPAIFATARVAEWLRHYGWGNFLGALRCRMLKGCHLTRCWNREAAPIHPAVMAQPSRYGWVTLSRWNEIRRTSRLTATADRGRSGPAGDSFP